MLLVVINNKIPAVQYSLRFFHPFFNIKVDGELIYIANLKMYRFIDLPKLITAQSLNFLMRKPDVKGFLSLLVRPAC